MESLRAGLAKAADHDGLYFQCLEDRSLRLQARVNPILRSLTLEDDGTVTGLLDALTYFKAKDGAIGRSAPLEFLSSTERQAVLADDRNGFRPSLYKAFLFLHVASAIKAGKLNMRHSYKDRPLDDYLIDRKRWQAEKEQLLERAGLTGFADPLPVLKMLDDELHRQYEATNRKAREGGNPHLRIKSNGRFRVQTPAVEDIESEPLRDSFPQRHYVPLAEILASVNRHCGLLDELRHWQQTHAPRKPSPAVLLAGIMGLGCGIGIRKMAQISPAIGERELENAVNWRFSLDNLVAANDRVVSAMDAMELPDIYRRSSGRLHTSSDGQKFEIRTESLNANYSFKYFGKGRGVSAYTFIDERNLLWYSLVFSASERESAYVIDGLMHNDVVDSDVHSADSHGYTEAIFGITHLLGVSYAPRIADLIKQQLYQFRSRKGQGADWLIKPGPYVNEAVILENWDDFLRLVVTIKLKEATASDIFRRLNSYSRQHELYRAVKAFGQIIKSIFILRYIDDLELRQAIEKQLNKVELANRFTRAVAVGNPREFTQAEKEEQEIAEACNRLIKNCIICWNYLYLSRKIAEARSDEERQRLLRTIASHSPIAWSHINLLGEYDLSDEKLIDSIGILNPKLPPGIIARFWEAAKLQKAA
ncbi:MAG: Tn3 family transposase [Geminicoccaceae bacterium]